MATFEYPNPLLDYKEEILLKKLTEKYENFCNPGFISKKIYNIEAKIATITPNEIKDFVNNKKDFLIEQIQLATEQDVIDIALKKAAAGGGILLQYLSEKTINKDSIIKNIEIGCGVQITFEEICALRSYTIESFAKKDCFAQILSACAEGGLTGAAGVYGIPLNLALSFLLFMRATQKIALTYGYDVCNDPREMEISSNVTMKCLFPSIDDDVTTMSGIIGKMAISSSLSELRDALTKKMTYTEMAKRGGCELLYVQIRALANKAAEKALNKAGAKGLEAGALKNLLTKVGEHLSQKTTSKFIPLYSAIPGALIDTYDMNRVLTGSNLIYHKRFLFEKEERVKCIIN